MAVLQAKFAAPLVARWERRRTKIHGAKWRLKLLLLLLLLLLLPSTRLWWWRSSWWCWWRPWWKSLRGCGCGCGWLLKPTVMMVTAAAPLSEIVLVAVTELERAV